jgi:hypothetical protein
VKPCYDLRNSEDLAESIQGLQGFWKLWSCCLLAESGIPTLQGFILIAPFKNPSTLPIELGSSAVLLRHDKRLESPPHPRGGFLVGREMLAETIQYFFDLGRIVAIYEPADPLLNGHNINVLFETGHKASAEIVGPGFDASDLQRGDISPHEAFSVRISSSGTVSETTLLQRISQEAYQESVTQRKEKIRTKLETAPSPELARRIRTNLGFPDDLEAHLRQIGSPLCASQDYKPVPLELLTDTVNKIISSGVIDRYLSLTGVTFPLVFSVSMVNRGTKQVFWDIVSPALKFEGMTKK